MTEWLPEAFAAPGKQARASDALEARKALALLACALVNRHHDHWLAEMMKAKPSAIAAQAVQALAASVSRNEAGDPSNAEREAKRAEQLFQSAGSEPGQLRARLEEVYALHRSLQGDRCLHAADGLGPAFEERDYAWDRAQLELERSICQAMVGNLGAAKQGARRAIALSEASHYATLRLRGLGIAASFETDAGNAVEGWSLDRAGLALYWAGSYPPVRAYQFYYDLATPAEESGQWHLATALTQEAVTSISASPSRSTEAMARYQLAKAATMAGAGSQAQAEYQRAGLLFAALPQTEATVAYRAYDELGLADLESRRGNFDGSFAHLEAIRPGLNRIADYFVPIRYYRALGSLQFKLGRYNEAEKAFRAALSIAETGLRSLQRQRDRLEWDRETRDVYRGLVGIRLRRDGDPQGALDLWEWYRAADSRSRAAGPEKRDSPGADLRIDFKALDVGPALPRIEPVRSILPSLGSETVLSYAQLEDGLEIWAFNNRGIEAKWVPVPSQTLDRLALGFARECADPSSNLARLRADGAQLYQWLVGPVEDRLTSGRTLVVEPDGALKNIPMQALLDSSGHYLGTRWALVVSPAAYRVTQGAQSVPPAFSSAQAALVVGAAALSGEMAGEFAPLPDAEREAQMVAARFQNATLLTGDHASLAALERQLSRVNIFHFAGHALAGGVRSGLLLAPTRANPGEQLLEAADLEHGQAPHCQLAVLSACSALSEERGFEDPQSLAEGFLRIGVPHVVASRWNVDSTVTEALMEAFYSDLLAGASVPQALRTAEAAIRKHQETDHPYFWACFGAFGRS